MTPAFEIFSGSDNVTEAIRSRLVSLSLTDEPGYSADLLEMRLDDRDGAIELPRRGVLLQVRMGYLDQDEGPRGTAPGLRPMGAFVVDEVSLEGPPSAMVIRARSANFRESLKEKKTRSWSDTTLRRIASEIAGDHDLALKMPPPPPTIHLRHLDQAGESDLNLLTRLADRYDYQVKLSGDNLVLAPAGAGEASSGAPVTGRTVRIEDVTDYRLVLSDRTRYRAVKAYWNDRGEGRREEVVEGSGDPSYVLRQAYPTEAEAAAAAAAKKRALDRSGYSLRLTLATGDPAVRSQSPLALAGFRPGILTDWIAARVSHRLSSEGYTTTLSATPNLR